jgi:hypothetical protein
MMRADQCWLSKGALDVWQKGVCKGHGANCVKQLKSGIFLMCRVEVQRHHKEEMFLDEMFVVVIGGGRDN